MYILLKNFKCEDWTRDTLQRKSITARDQEMSSDSSLLYQNVGGPGIQSNLSKMLAATTKGKLSSEGELSIYSPSKTNKKD